MMFELDPITGRHMAYRGGTAVPRDGDYCQARLGVYDDVLLLSNPVTLEGGTLFREPLRGAVWLRVIG